MPHRVRRLLVGLSVVLVLVVAGCGASRSGVEGKRDLAFRVVGYHAWWTGDAWQRYDVASLHELIFFDLRPEADGTWAATHGWPDEWDALVAHAAATGTALAPTVTVQDPDVFVALFSDDAAAGRLVENAVAAVQAAEADGLHLDVEVFREVPAAARAGYQRFVERLRAALPRATTLSMYMLAYDQGDVVDEAALAPLVDFFVVQGYDLHWRGGDVAGPVAPVAGWGGNNWGAVVQRFVDLGVPRRKLVMSVPFYGYEWPTESDALGARTRGRGRTITYARVDTLDGGTQLPAARERIRLYGVRRDPATRAPYYAYQDSAGGWWQGWYEDALSLEAKYAFVQRERLGGIALWLVGYDDGALQQTLRLVERR